MDIDRSSPYGRGIDNRAMGVRYGRNIYSGEYGQLRFRGALTSPYPPVDVVPHQLWFSRCRALVSLKNLKEARAFVDSLLSKT